MSLASTRRILTVLLVVVFVGGLSSPSLPDEGKAAKANRLAAETSPYLLLHAHNPVDWYPWGPEALERAKKENKPIFLSVGYSSCFWCHVMERLVFSNAEIAAYMNEHFVNIKVDREERPDVDDLYMTSLQVYYQLAGSAQGGGWPLSMFLTPDGEPFAGGTYFPPTAKPGDVDFPSYLRNIVKAWNDDREAVQTNAKVLTTHVKRLASPGLSLERVELSGKLIEGISQPIVASHDPEFGGVDFVASSPDGPKFPSPVRLQLLQYQASHNGNEKAAKVLNDTLDRMALGGIRDHLGGGFHRYSTDRRWHVPHFEKMLYDQAQLAELYVAEFERTGKLLYRDVAGEIFSFVDRELSDDRGGFHSALDAETEGVEGKYYVWSADEVTNVLGAEDSAVFKKVYGIEEPQGFEPGFVLHMPKPLAEVAGAMNVPESELAARLPAMRGKLLEARQKRTPLRRDDKVLTSWNGLMIRALARGGKALDRREYIERAARAARFVLAEMRDDQGRLRRTYRQGQTRLNAYLEDYALFVDGLLALHDATQADEWLTAARKLTDEQIELHWDKGGKAFFFTAHHHEGLIARAKDAYDSVLPAGNSVSAQNLVRLAKLTGDEKYRTYAAETLAVFAPAMKEGRGSLASMSLALAAHLEDAPAIASVNESSQELVAAVGEPAKKSAAAAEGSSVFREVQKPPADAAGKSGTKTNPHKIAAQVFLSVDKLPAGKSCRIAVQIDIEKGWHVNTNPAVPEIFVPTELTVISKQGVKLQNVTYPLATKKIEDPDSKQVQHVYENRVIVYGVLDVPRTMTSSQEEIEIDVKYQACNDRTCMPPKTFKLAGKLPVAGPNETVKPINQDKFPKVRREKSETKK